MEEIKYCGNCGNQGPNGFRGEICAACVSPYDLETETYGEPSNWIPKKENDMVSHPSHYQSKSGLEVMEVIKAFTEDLEGWEAVCTANIIKYICRWKKKNGMEDLEKCIQYAEFLIDYLKTKPKGE